MRASLRPNVPIDGLRGERQAGGLSQRVIGTRFEWAECRDRGGRGPHERVGHRFDGMIVRSTKRSCRGNPSSYLLALTALLISSLAACEEESGAQDTNRLRLHSIADVSPSIPEPSHKAAAHPS